MNKMTFTGMLEQARSEWEETLAQMNEQRMLQPGIVGSWSVKDLIAHISWYEREMVPVIQQHIFLQVLNGGHCLPMSEMS